jgi:hypothetical protein
MLNINIVPKCGMLFHRDRIGGIFDSENFGLEISLNFQAGGRGAKLNLLGSSVGYAVSITARYISIAFFFSLLPFSSM